MGWVVFGGDLWSASECLSAASSDESILPLQWPEHNGISVLTGLIIICSLYLLYYITFIVKKPRLFGGGATLRTHLVTNCPTLSQHYWPTAWAVNRHVMSMARHIVQRNNNVKYHRTVLTMPDGGEVGLDWGTTGSNRELKRGSPILLILPGITGGSDETYAKFLVEDGLNCGYRPVVYIQRGTGGLPLKTCRFICPANIGDIQHVLNQLHTSFPLSDVIAVGVSLGGIALTQYLHHMREHSDIKAAMVVSCLWDMVKSSHGLERQFINRNTYTKYLVSYIKEILKANAAVMRENPAVDLEHILKSTNFSEMNERLTCPVNGYRCCGDYYAAVSSSDKLHRITTPFLCLVATDDPFIPQQSLPLKEFSDNHNTLLVTTCSGGHNSFMEGLFPTSRSWMNRVVAEFLVAMTDYKQ